MMNSEHFEEYALIDAQIKSLTNKKEDLRVKIVQDMITAGAEKLETAFGKFTISKLKTWEYPKWVSDLGETYKAEKAKCEITGEAKVVSETESLRFTGAKL